MERHGKWEATGTGQSQGGSCGLRLTGLGFLRDDTDPDPSADIGPPREVGPPSNPSQHTDLFTLRTFTLTVVRLLPSSKRGTDVTEK